MTGVDHSKVHPIATQRSACMSRGESITAPINAAMLRVVTGLQLIIVWPNGRSVGWHGLPQLTLIAAFLILRIRHSARQQYCDEYDEQGCGDVPPQPVARVHFLLGQWCAGRLVVLARSAQALGRRVGHPCPRNTDRGPHPRMTDGHMGATHTDGRACATLSEIDSETRKNTEGATKSEAHARVRVGGTLLSELQNMQISAALRDYAPYYVLHARLDRCEVRPPLA